MKESLGILLILLFSPAGNAQDKIYFLNGQKAEATAIEVGEEVVLYKNFHNPDGPVYVVNRKDIAVIEYADGSFTVLKRTGYLGFSYDTVFTKQNILSLNLLGFIPNSAGFSYERISGNGKGGLRFPVTIGRAYSTIGMGYSYYPKRQEKYTLYLSGDFLLGLSSSFYGIALNTGFRANWNQHIALALEIGGDVLWKNKKITNVLFYRTYTPDLNLSYRF